MTRKEMIIKCVDKQIEKGIINATYRTSQIKSRLYGNWNIKPMSKTECEKWYNELFI